MSSSESNVREHGMLFSDEMVRALLAGRKTQTRRLLTAGNTSGNVRASKLDLSMAWVDDGPSPAGNPGPYLKAPLLEWPDDARVERLYPRFQVGDRIWVREAWGMVRMHELGQHVFGDGPIPDRDQIVYRAGRLVIVPPKTAPLPPIETWPREWRDDHKPTKWRPSLLMPRSASRITLEITRVRIERLQQITEDDAKAEGCHGTGASDEGMLSSALPLYTAAYAQLWDSINAKRATWASDPWVIALDFRVG